MSEDIKKETLTKKINISGTDFWQMLIGQYFDKKIKILEYTITVKVEKVKDDGK